MIEIPVFQEVNQSDKFSLVVVLLIGQQILEGAAMQDNISNTGHIIGGVVGNFVGYQLNRRSR